MPPPIREALRPHVAQELLGAIFRGDLPAGTRLVTQRLADRYGCSATPVREALVELEQVGVVQLLHNRSAVVKPFGREEIREIFHIRRILEGEAARCACPSIPREPLVGARAAIQRLKARSLAGDAELGRAILATDRQIHGLIAAHCGNARLRDEIRTYDGLSTAMLRVCDGWGRSITAVLDQLGAIVRALLAHDADKAAHAMSLHVAAVGKLVEEALLGAE